MTANPADLEVVRHLCDAWISSLETMWDDDARPGEGHCIEAAKYSVEALRRLGVKARPLPCGIVVANGQAQPLITAKTPIEEWPEEAWSVGVDPDSRLPGRGWDGHLVTVGEGWLADFSARQFARPKPHLRDLHAWVSETPPGFDPAGDAATLLTDGSTFVTVFPRRKLARWRSTNAWRGSVKPWVIDPLLAAYDGPRPAILEGGTSDHAIDR